MPDINGSNLISGVDSALGSVIFRSVDPRTGEPGRIEFHEATAEEIATAVEAASIAADALAGADDASIAELLRAVADGLEAVGDDLIGIADEETALGLQRLDGERARTCSQLRAFAEFVASGRHHEPIIDHADAPGRPDVRRILVPLGPVAVFGASNFPLAFSVPGGDTASALAAACPVVVKGHPSHPGTSESCGRVIAAAVNEAGFSPGTFSLVQGASADVGRELVLAPDIRAVAFTGSARAGRALYDLAATRPVPVPVYAEMGSLNPVFVTQAAIASRGDAIAADPASSVTLGAGQFCTKPGLVFVPAGDEGDTFAKTLAERLREVDPQPLLNPGIQSSLRSTVEDSSSVPGVEVVVPGGPDARAGTWTAPSLLETDLDTFLTAAELVEEHFGPVTILVRGPLPRLAEAARRIEGSLTATIYGQPGPDDELVDALLPELTKRAGRVVFDGVPTGVAVVEAMQHGGPYPAATFSGHTSVGLTAIRRFLRPVAFQNAPQRWLPEHLREKRGP